jgi:hypothetical protein
MRADRLELLGRVGAVLEARSGLFAVIGAAALAVRGVARTTFDIDLLTTDASVLDSDVWVELQRDGVRVEVRKGDFDDPLAGVVRFDAEDARPIDLVVGKMKWQQALIERSPVEDLFVARMRVPDAADLILLKLDAGGPQDLWDVHQLLALGDRDSVVATVNARVDEVGDDARSLWTSVLSALR